MIGIWLSLHRLTRDADESCKCKATERETVLFAIAKSQRCCVPRLHMSRIFHILSISIIFSNVVSRDLNCTNIYGIFVDNAFWIQSFDSNFFFSFFLIGEAEINTRLDD